MDNNNIFIPGQILTILIALLSCIKTHSPLIIKKEKIFILIEMKFLLLLFEEGGSRGWESFGFLYIVSLYTWPCFYIWLLDDFHPIL